MGRRDALRYFYHIPHNLTSEGYKITTFITSVGRFEIMSVDENGLAQIKMLPLHDRPDTNDAGEEIIYDDMREYFIDECSAIMHVIRCKRQEIHDINNEIKELEDRC